MVNKPDKQILEYKKNLFTEHVGKSAKLLDVPVPKVKFWGHWGDHFHEGERAHIHIEENKICIAETELNLMTEEEIKVTASHEVSHIHHQDHGMEFQRTQNITEFGLWERPPGTIGALPEDYEPEKIKERKNRQVKYRCNYHLCNKRTKTKKCKYCENYFCADHINPSEPHMGNISESYNRLEEKNTHPCMPYFHYLEKKKKLEDERYGKALDRMFFRKKEAQVVEYKIIPKKETERKSKPDNLERERIHQKDEEIKKTLREGLEMHRLKKRRKKRPILIIVILFLILGAIFIFSYFSQEASKMDMRGNLSASIGQKVIVENNVKECYFKLNDDELKKRLCLYEIDGGIFLPTTFEVNNFEIEEKYSVRGILKESTNNEIYLDGISYEKMD